MMRKNNNRGNNNMKHRSGGGSGGGRRYNGGSGGGNSGGNRGGHHDGQNIARQKHHATQQLGKYGDMARNAQINGDRVDVEYYLQHVDHYTRVLADITAIEAERFAHQRELHAQHQPQENGNGDDTNVAQHQETQHQPATNGHDGETVATESAEAQPQPTHQPRPRGRRNHNTQVSDNGAAEANSNTTDIPLPTSILPAIEAN